MNTNKRLAMLNLTVAIIIATLGFMVKASDEGILFDYNVMEWVHSKATPWGIQLMKGISFLGSVYFILPMGILLLFIMTIKKDRNGIILILLSSLGSYGLNVLIKTMVGRIRPLKYFLVEQGGYSYPSGHAMVSMTFFTTMTYLLLGKKEDKTSKNIAWSINLILIGLIGISRIYLGVHWPTDVLMGYLLGYIYYHNIIYIFP